LAPLGRGERHIWLFLGLRGVGAWLCLRGLVEGVAGGCEKWGCAYEDEFHVGIEARRSQVGVMAMMYIYSNICYIYNNHEFERKGNYVRSRKQTPQNIAKQTIAEKKKKNE
jgi:hypothetical protein